MRRIDRIGVLLLVLAMVACGGLGSRVLGQSPTATVIAYKTAGWSPAGFDPSQILERTGNPTQAQIDDFASGALRWLKFTSTHAKFTAAFDSDADCTTAVDFACESLGNDIRTTHHDRPECAGTCLDASAILITVE